MTDQRPRNLLQRLPLPAFFVVVLVLWVVLQTVFSNRTVDAISLGGHVLGGLIFATVLTISVGVRRKRLGGADELIHYNRALKTGSLPAGVDTHAWSAELDRSVSAARRARWFIRVGALLPLGLGIWGATDPEARLLGIVLAVLAVAAIVAGEISTPRQLARIDRLREALAS